MSNRFGITIGCDPEVPLMAADGSVVSAIGLLGGTKDKPRQTKFGAIHEDNVFAEFGIEPASSREQFVQSCVEQLKELDSIVSEHGLKHEVKTSLEFPQLQLEHPLALEAGCEADYNAYTYDVNPKADYMNTNLRVCGGHIHLGVPGIDEYPSARIELVRALDATLGCVSTWLDKDNKRKALYGKAGCFRPKDYGVEYRTPSNWWLKNEKMMGFVYDIAVSVSERFVERGMAPFINSAERRNTIREAINTSHRDHCKHWACAYISSRVLSKWL